MQLRQNIVTLHTSNMKPKKFLPIAASMALMGGIAHAAEANPERMRHFVDSLMAEMTLEEKIGQINLASGMTDAAVLAGAEGTEMYQAVREGRIGATGASSFDVVKKIQESSQESAHKIPLLIGLDVIHGLNTVFPIPLALSCTFDTDLIEESARIAARESVAAGVNWTYSPMVDISRDPRWGRVSEGGGEDPWWGSQVARAMVHGYQGDDLSADSTIMACVKHFALYGASEAGRDYNTVDMSRQKRLNDYLPPYKAAFQAGAGSGMSSFNLIDGIPATGNRWLMTDLLRGEWGWDGFIVTDFDAINEMMAHGLGDSISVSVQAINAGTDMDMQSNAYEKYMKRAIEQGLVSMETLDTACRRVLEAKYKLGLFDNPYLYNDPQRNATEPASSANLAAARRIAAKSMVLLKNEDNLLPLKKQGKIAVVGPLAEAKGDLLGAWVMKRDKTHMISVADALKQACGNEAEVVTAKGANVTEDPTLLSILRSPYAMFMGEPLDYDSRSPQELIDEALATAQDADVIVAVLGETAAMSGEASSRSDISIPESQRSLLKALLATGKPIALVIINGRPLTIQWESENVPAILEAWAPGTASGYAVADVLFGEINPSGRLTMTFPRSVGQIPIYYNHKPTGRPFDPVNKFTSKYLDCPNEPLYPFGYGLSYTEFEYSDLALSKTDLLADECLRATVTVKNTGDRMGEEVVQLYVADLVARISRPVKELKGIQKISLNPGESRQVTFTLTADDLKYFDADGNYDWDGGEFVIMVGRNSSDVKSAKVNWSKGEAIGLLPAVGKFATLSDPAVTLSPAIYYSDKTLAPLAEILAQDLKATTGVKFSVSAKSPEKAGIILTLGQVDGLGQTYGTDPAAGDDNDEAYAISIAGNQATLTANSYRGLTNACSSLRQLITTEAGAVKAPALEIADAPRLAWRGLLLDVSRHFFTPVEVKQVIDAMALYKMNVLHLHLSDNQGWRFEVKGYKPLSDQYYTQKEYSDLVAYASVRGITIVPELDLPGHSAAVFQAFPQFSNTASLPFEFNFPGQEICALDPDDAEAMEFVKAAITQLCALTPGQYIHIGGDETFGMHDEPYSKFVKQVKALVRSCGKQVAGWQEMARADVGEGDVVQNWIRFSRKQMMMKKDAGKSSLPDEVSKMLGATYMKAPSDLPTSIQNGAKVLLSPLAFAYHDCPFEEENLNIAYQERSRELGLKNYAPQNLRDIYEWDPTNLYPYLDIESNIAGIEATLFCETIQSLDDAFTMILPRLASIAEHAWNCGRELPWDGFSSRLPQHESLYRLHNWPFFKSSIIPWN